MIYLLGNAKEDLIDDRCFLSIASRPNTFANDTASNIWNFMIKKIKEPAV